MPRKGKKPKPKPKRRQDGESSMPPGADEIVGVVQEVESTSERRAPWSMTLREYVGGRLQDPSDFLEKLTREGFDLDEEFEGDAMRAIMHMLPKEWSFRDTSVYYDLFRDVVSVRRFDRTTLDNLITSVKPFVGRTEHFHSVTIVAENVLATHGHGDHAEWDIGSEVSVVFQSKAPLVARVFYKSKWQGMCLLKTEEKLSAPLMKYPYMRELYVVLGHSEIATPGFISSETSTYSVGSAYSLPHIDDYGAGVFSVTDGRLLGINVGNKDMQHFIMSSLLITVLSCEDNDIHRSRPLD